MSSNDIDFKIPIQKTNSYISYTTKPLKINLSEVKIKNIKKLTNTNGYCINIYIPSYNNEDNVTNIVNADKNALDKILLNNDKWFNNGLDENELKDLYKPSLCSQTNTLNCILSNNIPYNIKINNTNYTDDSKLLDILLNLRELKKYIISLELSHVGLYFYPELSINKWLIKSINITNIEYDICTWNRYDIEYDWETCVEETIEHINEIISIKNEEIYKLNNSKDNINKLLKDVKKIENTDNLWENKISSLKNLIIESSNRILSTKDNR